MAVLLVVELALTSPSSSRLHLAYSLYQKVEIDRLGFLPKDVGIAAPADTLNKYVQKGCHTEGIALYDDHYNTLDVDEENYEMLSNTEKAGLFLHEAIYKYLRDVFKVQNSIVARAYTACAFSEIPCPELSSKYEVPEKYPYLCRMKGEERTGPTFIVFPRQIGGGKWRFQIANFAGETPPSRAYMDLDVDMRPTAEKTFSPEVVGHRRHEVEKIWTKTSDNRWRNFGISFPFVVSKIRLPGKKYPYLTFNQKRVNCWKVRWNN